MVEPPTTLPTTDIEEDLFNLPVMIHCINGKGEIIEVNDCWLETMGYSRNEVLGKKSTDFLADESRDYASQEGLPEFFKTGYVQNVAYTFVKKSGELLSVLLSARSHRSKEGVFLHSFAISINITEQNKLKVQLQESESRYRSMVAGMMNGFALHQVIVDEDNTPKDYRFLEVNKAFEKATGLQGKEIIGKTLLEIFPDADGAWIETFGHVALTGQSIHFERFSKELQRYYDILAFCPEKGQFAIVITDITSRKLTEIALNESERQFRRTFDQSPIGVAMVDLSLRFRKVNRELCRITGYSEEELITLGMREITHKDDLQASQEKVKALITGQINQYQTDKRYIRKDGTSIWTRVSVRLIRDYTGKPLYFIPMMEDIDQRKKLEDEKEELLELLTIINKDSNLEIFTESLLPFLVNRTVVDAIGIRIRQGRDYPYYKTIGFHEEFTARENSLLRFDNGGKPEEQLDCMCGYTIQNVNKPKSPFFTENGSFITNSTSQLLTEMAGVTNHPRLRQHCNQAGFESVFLLPLRVGQNTLGLLQLNCIKKDSFSKTFIARMERLAHHISLALIQRLAEEELNTKKIELEETNAALKVLLNHQQNQQMEKNKELMQNLRRFVLPYIDRLKVSDLSTQQQAQLRILETNLESITSPLSPRGQSASLALTPTLNQVADLIRNGLTNKEIAKVLNISVSSVETYRKRIRARLNLKHSKINLRTHLLKTN